MCIRDRKAPAETPTGKKMTLEYFAKRKQRTVEGYRDMYRESFRKEYMVEAKARAAQRRAARMQAEDVPAESLSAQDAALTVAPVVVDIAMNASDVDPDTRTAVDTGLGFGAAAATGAWQTFKIAVPSYIVMSLTDYGLRNAEMDAESRTIIDDTVFGTLFGAQEAGPIGALGGATVSASAAAINLVIDKHHYQKRKAAHNPEITDKTDYEANYNNVLNMAKDTTLSTQERSKYAATAVYMLKQNHPDLYEQYEKDTGQSSFIYNNRPILIPHYDDDEEEEVVVVRDNQDPEIPHRELRRLTEVDPPPKPPPDIHFKVNAASKPGTHGNLSLADRKIKDFITKNSKIIKIAYLCLLYTSDAADE